MKPWEEVIDGIRNAIHGKEVREDIAQMGEYVEQFASSAKKDAETASDAADTAVEKAEEAKTTISSAIDSTLSVSGKAADAAKVGEAINAEAKRAKGVESQLKEDLGDVLNKDSESKSVSDWWIKNNSLYKIGTNIVDFITQGESNYPTITALKSSLSIAGGSTTNAYFDIPFKRGKKYAIYATYYGFSDGTNESNIRIYRGGSVVASTSKNGYGTFEYFLTSDGTEKIRIYNSASNKGVFKIYELFIAEYSKELNDDSNKAISELIDSQIDSSFSTSFKLQTNIDFSDYFDSSFTLNKTITSNGAIKDITGYAYSSVLHVYPHEIISLEGDDPIYRIAIYSIEPNIGTTKLKSYINEKSIYYSPKEEEYICLCINTSQVGNNPKIYKNAFKRFELLQNELLEIHKNLINATRSGVIKNASAFGFLPTNDAETNSTALQNAVNGGGTIVVDFAGTYPVCKSLILDSNTTLIFGNNVYLRRETDSKGIVARYPFINKGAFTREYNENISIIGLNLLTNGYGSGTDVDEIRGQKGQLAFYCVKHLTIKDFTISDGTAIYYNIHIQNFEDIHLENIHIISAKDGIHLGKGKDFVIKNAWLKTNDDGIALNAHDYPTGTSELGWIENGIIENIHFLSAPDFNRGRGLYLLGGAWTDWVNGMEVRKYGDTVVSNGRIYRTYGTPISQTKETIISTIQPNHTNGVQTYSDGVTWLMAQDNDICYNAGCRNIHYKDIFFDRLTSGALTFNFDNDIYSRSIYPTCELPMMENITLENFRAKKGAVQHIVNSCVPFDNLKLIDILCNNTGNIVFMYKSDNTIDYPQSTVLIDKATLKNDSALTTILARNDLLVKAKIVGSMPIGLSNSFSTYGNVTLISNDLNIV